MCPRIEHTDSSSREVRGVESRDGALLLAVSCLSVLVCYVVCVLGGRTSERAG